MGRSITQAIDRCAASFAVVALVGASPTLATAARTPAAASEGPGSVPAVKQAGPAVPPADAPASAAPTASAAPGTVRPAAPSSPVGTASGTGASAPPPAGEPAQAGSKAGPDPKAFRASEPEGKVSRAAQAELEGDVRKASTEVPERLPRLDAAAWWTTFGAFALGTTAGVFAGLTEKQEDEAERLVSLREGGAFPLYEEHRGEYEKILDRGHRYEWTARGFVLAGAAALVVAVSLFAVSAKRRKVATSLSKGAGLRVQF